MDPVLWGLVGTIAGTICGSAATILAPVLANRYQERQLAQELAKEQATFLAGLRDASRQAVENLRSAMKEVFDDAGELRDYHITGPLSRYLPSQLVRMQFGSVAIQDATVLLVEHLAEIDLSLVKAHRKGALLRDTAGAKEVDGIRAAIDEEYLRVLSERERLRDLIVTELAKRWSDRDFLRGRPTGWQLIWLRIKDRVRVRRAV